MWKRNRNILATLFCAVVVSMGAGNGKYAVCHRDFGRPQVKLIFVGSQNAYDAHIAHGDYGARNDGEGGPYTCELPC